VLGRPPIKPREDREAILIIGVMLAPLAKIGNRQGFRPVWTGTILALFVSLAAGGIIYLSTIKLTGRAEQLFEDSALLLAAGC